MTAYRDDLAAAIARAEAAEKALAEERVKKGAGPKREPGRFGAWWHENWPGVGAFASVGLGVLLVILAVVLPGIHSRDIRSCRIEPKDCLYDHVLCPGAYQIIGERPWAGDAVLKEAGEFKSVEAARARAKEIGCPAVKP